MLVQNYLRGAKFGTEVVIQHEGQALAQLTVTVDAAINVPAEILLKPVVYFVVSGSILFLEVGR